MSNPGHKNLKPFNRLTCMFTNNDICVVYTDTYVYCLLIRKDVKVRKLFILVANDTCTYI